MESVLFQSKSTRSLTNSAAGCEGETDEGRFPIQRTPINIDLLGMLHEFRFSTAYLRLVHYFLD